MAKTKKQKQVNVNIKGETEVIKFSLDFDQSLELYLQKYLKRYKNYRILAKTLDARKKRGHSNQTKPRYHYTIELYQEKLPKKLPEKIFEYGNQVKQKFQQNNSEIRPLIIGAGPAGLFCALKLLDLGIVSTIIERGEAANKRMKAIARFWRYGEFDPNNNVCFGEGGAGLFSDGKLITRVKSSHIQYVMNRMVDFGAPEEIAYRSNPHLGSNKIRGLITKMTDYLKEQGCQIHYRHKVVDFLFEGQDCVGVIDEFGREHRSSHLILASGHSSSDLYESLYKHQVKMKLKDFAVGVRVEHKREYINQLQYGTYWNHPELETARYRLSYHNKETDLGTYSFCMCPGGYVLSSGTEADGLVTNGMSNYSRHSPWSNSALVVTVKAGELQSLPKNEASLFKGLNFQRQLEQKAYDYSRQMASGRELPAQKIEDFLQGKQSLSLDSNSCPSGLVKADLNELLPRQVVSSLKLALTKFNQMIPGFITNKGVLIAPETRTSSPLTIERDPESLQSTSYSRLYPCGEGAGYAGGITSAAVDGVKVALKIVEN